MQEKTPRFNALLIAYYQDKKPGTFTCSETGESFEIPQDIYNLYKGLDFPLPTSAPHIRLRQQRAHIGGLELFARSTSEGKTIISMYDPNSSVSLLEPVTWYGDTFEGTNYPSAIDTTQAFFPQWKKFSEIVPRPAIFNDPNSSNCSWCLYELEFKNSYATYGGLGCVDVMYADMAIRANNSVDIIGLVDSEWSYESAQLVECSNATWSEYCVACLNIAFCFGCKNCTDCFGSVNIKNKKYYFLNEQLSEEEYKQKISEIDLSDADTVEYWKEKTKDLWKQGYYMAESNFKSENVLGDDLIDCKSVFGISMFGSNRVYNGFDASFIKDSCDISTCTKLERSIGSTVCINGYENKMCISCDGCMDVEYSEICISCEHCFGCIGLKRKQFCIFNVQYSEEEYWKKLDEIKSEMLTRGEYGQFFPYNTSMLSYNTSHADAFFPITKDEAEKLGSRWYTFPQTDTSKASPLETLPKKLSETSTEILEKQFICAESGRPFRIVKSELEFHQKMKIALPRKHPTVRRKQRYKKFLELRIYPRNCEKCQKNVFARISPKSEAHILCDECYNQLLLS